MKYDGVSRGFDRRINLDSMGTVTYGDATTRTCSIAVKSGESNYKFMIAGRWHYKTATESLACPDITGTYYWSFDKNGTFSVANHADITGDIFTSSAIVGLAYYNKEEGTFVGAKDEQHGFVLDPEAHLNIHLTRGLSHYIGGNIVGLVDAGSTFTSVGASVHLDEDIPISIEELTTMPFAYLKTQLGVNGWVLTAADNKIGYINSGDTYASYNGDTGGGVYDLIQSTGTTDYIIYMILATNLTGDWQKVKVIGQQVYPSRAKARAGLNNALEEIKLLGFPSAEAEWQFAYICKRDATLEDDGYGNAYVDLRGRKLS